MIANKDLTIDRPVEAQSDWLDILKLVKTEKYEQAAGFLQEAQLASEEMGDAVQAEIIAATRLICQALRTSQAEMTWHQQAYEETSRRENELRQGLQSLLDLIYNGDLPETDRGSTDLFPAGKIDFSKHNGIERVGVLQRIQHLLGWRTPSLPLKEPVAPVATYFSTEDSTEAHGSSTRFKGVRQTLRDSIDAKRENFTSQPNPLVKKPLRVPGERATAGRGGEGLFSEKIVESSEPFLAAGPEPANLNAPSLTVYCFGSFCVYLGDQLLDNSASRKSQGVFKYLVTHWPAPVSKDILMDVFWPEADPEAARRNLHQAIYSLRQTLKINDCDFQFIQFENDCYHLNPDLNIWLDYEEFEAHIRAGRRLEQQGEIDQAMTAYSIAEGLYQGDFLAEDLYEEWSQPLREQFQQTYLSIAHRLAGYYLTRQEVAATIILNQRILLMDNCQEEAHQNLMRCYLAQGQRHLALRQYQLCVQALKTELGFPPSAETQALYQKIAGL